MADMVMSAMDKLVPKLYQLLQDEYKLQAGVKDRITSLTMELKQSQAALGEVGQVPWDKLDSSVQIWAREVRESSLNMEDTIDTFLVRVQGCDSAEQRMVECLGIVTNTVKKYMARRTVAGEAATILSHLKEVTDRCDRFKVQGMVSRPDIPAMVDPRLAAMYINVKKLIGIEKSSCELISKLESPMQQDGASNTKIKIVSVVGVGGLGKTTLAKAVYNELISNFDCGAFVPVGRNPDLKKVFKDILKDLDVERYLRFSKAELDEKQLIDELRKVLLHKRYLIVIDDLWEKQSWGTIKLAFDDDNNCGGRIIITTRKLRVARTASEVYGLQPLPDDSSRKLLYARIYGDKAKCLDEKPDVTNKILTKCAGVPLAIITMASLLTDKEKEEWAGVIESIGFGSNDKEVVKNTRRILSFSYYDLPLHLRTCLLYFDAFPEESVIHKDELVWKWVAEGFVHGEPGISLFEIGEGYLNNLINRSLVQPVEADNSEVSIMYGDVVYLCRVHDMVLDLIRSKSDEEKFFTVSDVLAGEEPC